MSSVSAVCRQRGYRLGIEYDEPETLGSPRLQVRHRDRDDWADCDLIASVPFGDGQATLDGAAAWLRLYLHRLGKQEEAT